MKRICIILKQKIKDGVKKKYKTLSEIKKMHSIKWLQAFSWIYTKEGNDFWNKLDIKWKQLYRKNIDNIVWE